MRAPSNIFPIVSLDGAFVPAAQARVSAFDRGFLMADGAFETLHVHRGTPLALDAHLARLTRAADFLQIPLPWDADALTDLVRGLLSRNGIAEPDSGDAALRLNLSRGAEPDGPPTAFIFLRQVGPANDARRGEGILLHTLPIPGRGTQELARHKTLSYLPSALSQIWLRSRTTDPRAEGLFLSETGQVLEGSATNILIVEGDRLLTPPVSDGVLPGTARDLALRLAASQGLSAAEESITLARLSAADEVLATASTLHVAPVVSLDGAPLGGGRPGPRTARLAAAFEGAVADNVARWHRGA